MRVPLADGTHEWQFVSTLKPCDMEGHCHIPTSEEQLQEELALAPETPVEVGFTRTGGAPLPLLAQEDP
eukprot:2405614-Pyramimonas_sp.AAC.1